MTFIAGKGKNSTEPGYFSGTSWIPCLLFVSNININERVWMSMQAVPILMTLTIMLKIEEDRIIESPYILFKLDVSEAEFWTFAHEDLNCELLDGVLVIHSPANQEHEDIFGYLYTLFRQYLESKNEGQVFGSRFVMRLSEKWSPEPDLLVITPDKYETLKAGRLEGPADLVVEILSDATRDVDINKKLPRYLESGVKEVWIIDPASKIITIHEKARKSSFDDPESAKAIHSTVLKGFKVQPRWIWHRKEYPTIACIKKLLGIS